MKVLQVTSNYPTERHPVFGIFMKEQAESMAPLGVESDIFYSNGKERGGMKEHFRSIFRMMGRRLRGRYDLIHCHHAVSGLILVLSGSALFNKCVLSYQNDPDHEYGRWVFRLLYPFFNRIIIKNSPSPYLRYKKTVYLPNGCNSDFFHPIDTAEARARLGWAPDRRYILYMDSNKGRRTQKRKDRYDSVLRLLRDDYGHDNIVSVELSDTPREQMPLIINACDLHLMTSDFEGSPNSVKECLCCNVPVVSTPVGNVPDMLNGISGCHVTGSFSEAELARCCDSVLRQPRAGFHGRDAFLAKGYSITDVAARLNDIYRNL